MWFYHANIINLKDVIKGYIIDFKNRNGKII